MSSLIKGQKYLMFVDIRKVGCLVDKLQFNYILFIYLSYLFFNICFILFFMVIVFFLVVFLIKKM